MMGLRLRLLLLGFCWRGDLGDVGGDRVCDEWMYG
jgi:hypothetical protein